MSFYDPETRKYHIRRTVQLENFVFISEEKIAFLEGLPFEFNKHIGVVLFPFKFEFNNQGCSVTELDIAKDRLGIEKFDYPLHRAYRIPRGERRRLTSKFFDLYYQMCTSWNRQNYRLFKQNCQHFAKVLTEGATGHRLPVTIQRKIYKYGDLYESSRYPLRPASI